MSSMACIVCAITMRYSGLEPVPRVDMRELVDRAYFAGTASPDAYDPASSAYTFRSLPT